MRQQQEQRAAHIASAVTSTLEETAAAPSCDHAAPPLALASTTPPFPTAPTTAGELASRARRSPETPELTAVQTPPRNWEGSQGGEGEGITAARRENGVGMRVLQPNADFVRK